MSHISNLSPHYDVQCLKMMIALKQNLMEEAKKEKKERINSIIIELLNAYRQNNIEIVLKTSSQSGLLANSLFEVSLLGIAVQEDCEEVYSFTIWCVEEHYSQEFGVFLSVLLLLGHASHFTATSHDIDINNKNKISKPYEEYNQDELNFGEGSQTTGNGNVNSVNSDTRNYVDRFIQIAKKLPTPQLILLMKVIPDRGEKALQGQWLFSHMHEIIQARSPIDRFQLGKSEYWNKGDRSLLEMMEQASKKEYYSFSPKQLINQYRTFYTKEKSLPDNYRDLEKHIRQFNSQQTSKMQGALMTQQSFKSRQEKAALALQMGLYCYQQTHYCKAYHFYSMSMDFCEHKQTIIRYRTVVNLLKLNCYEQAQYLIGRLLADPQRQTYDEAIDLNMYATILRKLKKFKEAKHYLLKSHRYFQLANYNAKQIIIEIFGIDSNSLILRVDLHQKLKQEKNVICLPTNDNTYSINFFELGALYLDQLQELQKAGENNHYKQTSPKEVLDESERLLLLYVKMNPNKQMRSYMYLVKLYIRKQQFTLAHQYLKPLLPELRVNTYNDLQQQLTFLQYVARHQKYFPEYIKFDEMVDQLRRRTKKMAFDRIESAKKYMRGQYYRSALIALLSVRQYKAVKEEVSTNEFHSRILKCYLELDQVDKGKLYFLTQIKEPLMVNRLNVGFLKSMFLSKLNGEEATKILDNIKNDLKKNKCTGELFAFIHKNTPQLWSKANQAILSKFDTLSDSIQIENNSYNSFFNELYGLLEKDLKDKFTIETIQTAVERNDTLLEEISKFEESNNKISFRLLFKIGVYLVCQNKQVPGKLCLRKAIEMLPPEAKQEQLTQLSATLNNLRLKQELYSIKGKQIWIENQKLKMVQNPNVKKIVALCNIWKDFLELEKELFEARDVVVDQKDNDSCQILSKSLQFDRNREAQLKIITYASISERKDLFQTTIDFLKSWIKVSPTPTIFVFWKKLYQRQQQTQQLWISQLLEIKQIQRYSRLFVALEKPDQYSILDQAIVWISVQKGRIQQQKNKKGSWNKVEYQKLNSFFKKYTALLQQSDLSKHKFILSLTPLFNVVFSAQLPRQELSQMKDLLNQFNQEQKNRLENKIKELQA